MIGGLEKMRNESPSLITNYELHSQFSKYLTGENE